MLKVWGFMAPLPPGYAYFSQSLGHRIESQILTEKANSKQD